MFDAKKYPLQQVLELACAAERSNKGYVKTIEAIYATEDDGKFKTMAYKHPNKTLMLVALGEDKTSYTPEFPKPELISTNLADRELATEIQKYYRRLAFAAIEGTNEFQIEVNSLLNSEDIPLNKLGFIACLPSTYKRDYSKNQMEKRVKTVDDGYLDNIGSSVFDLDCEVLAVQRSKNFDAWNIDAIINNKMVSWMSKNELKLGACVVIKAKVKDHSKHWKYENPVTRLNYVKAAQ